MQTGWASPEFIIKKSNGVNTKIQGYASVFNVLDKHNDTIVKGAFKSSYENQVKLLWQHDSTKPIGIITSMNEDDHGLKIEAEINNNTQNGLDASQLIKQRAVSGLSIGFNIKSYDYDEHGHRTITDLDLMEVSIVTFPANDSATISQIKSRYEKVNSSNIAIKNLESLINKLKNL